MTPSEFKAWFDGFTEAFGGRIPTKAQWARVKERVSEIDGKPVTERIYVDRYWHQYYGGTLSPFINVSPLNTYTTCGTSLTLSGTTISGGGVMCAAGSKTLGTTSGFDSHSAMASLGYAEAQSLAS